LTDGGKTPLLVKKSQEIGNPRTAASISTAKSVLKHTDHWIPPKTKSAAKTSGLPIVSKKAAKVSPKPRQVDTSQLPTANLPTAKPAGELGQAISSLEARAATFRERLVEIEKEIEALKLAQSILKRFKS
jgi:hypothetical protein